MGIQVGTIFKWYSADDMDDEGNSLEGCEDGQCVGIVLEVIDPPKTDFFRKPGVMVKFWEKCGNHAAIDPEGAGPYELDYIWQIGLLY